VAYVAVRADATTVWPRSSWIRSKREDMCSSPPPTTSRSPPRLAQTIPAPRPAAAPMTRESGRHRVQQGRPSAAGRASRPSRSLCPRSSRSRRRGRVPSVERGLSTATRRRTGRRTRRTPRGRPGLGPVPAAAGKNSKAARMASQVACRRAIPAMVWTEGRAREAAKPLSRLIDDTARRPPRQRGDGRP
jgi:hypothetical protein